MSIPLVALDPRAWSQLRSEKHAELKNELMMSLLTRVDWFVAYRDSLRRYREHGGEAPEYPSDRVDKVETLVDRLIADVVDPLYVRRM